MEVRARLQELIGIFSRCTLWTRLLELSSNSDKKAVEKAMKGHVLAQGELIGLYSRA